MRKVVLILAVLMMLMSVIPGLAQDDAVELRVTWYDDGNEGAVLRDLLDRFEADNPDITVVIDTVAYNTILENLPIQLEAGEGPDMARVTDLGGLSEFYLDISDLVEDPQYWEDSFGPFLNWLRPAGDEDGIYGMMTQLTVTGPYINRSLFEEAGVDVPSDSSDSVTWEEWAEASNAVAEALGIDFAMAMDRSGHRFAGPAISMGAAYFDEDGNPALIDDGFTAMAELMVQWHEDGTMLPDVWVGTSGTYAAGNEFYTNEELVFYMSGSWQIGQFAENIGDTFAWEAVPNPCGPGGCTGMPGGAALVAVGDTEHPEEVARVMDYLASEEVLAEFSARTLFIPAHLGLAESGVDFDTDNEFASAALSSFVAQVGTLEQTAFDLQAYGANRDVFNATVNRLTEVLAGELELEDALARIQEDVDAALAEAES